MSELGLIYVDSQGSFKRIPVDAADTLGDAAAKAMNVEHVHIEDQNGGYHSRFVLVTSEERYAPKELDWNPAMEFLHALPGASFGLVFQWDALVLGRYRTNGASASLEFAFTEDEMNKLEKHFELIKRNISRQRDYSKLEEEATGSECPEEPKYEEEEMSDFEVLVGSDDEASDDEDDDIPTRKRSTRSKRSRDDDDEDEEDASPKKKARFLFIGFSRDDETKYVEEILFDDADAANDVYQLENDDIISFLEMAAEKEYPKEENSNPAFGRLMDVVKKDECGWDNYDRSTSPLGAFDDVISYDLKK
jgi:hypothetical protein